jgi:DNA polymerase III alpha subunit
VAGSDFVSLHTHSLFSLMEGVPSLDALLARAAELGYTELALSDSNSLLGAVAFADKAPRHGIRPLLGASLSYKGQRVVALCENEAGYRNLCRIISRISARQPASLAAILCAHAEGLHLLVDNAALLVRPLPTTFAGRLWIEVVRPAQADAKEAELLEAARRLGLPLVASLAAHFCVPEEHEAFRFLAAVRSSTTLERLPPSPIGQAHHLCAPQEVLRRFRSCPGAVKNSRRLAEILQTAPLPRKLALPPLLKGTAEQDANARLRALCEAALPRRPLEDRDTARRRLDDQLTVIAGCGLAAYFLAVHDGCSAAVAKFALVVLVDVRRRLARLAERVESGPS